MDPAAALLVIVLLVAATTLLGLAWRHRQGRLVTTSPGTESTPGHSPGSTAVIVVTAAELGLPGASPSFGTAATLVQFSTEFCARCPGTSVLLGQMADARPGVRHVNVDLTHRADLARRFNVLQTPTTLVLDGAGRGASAGRRRAQPGRPARPPRRPRRFQQPGALMHPGAPMTQPQPDPQSQSQPATPARPGIDPRGPRFGAGITAVVLLVVIFLALVGASAAALTLLALQTAVFAWGAIAGIRRHPYGLLYRAVLRPRLGPPVALEDPAPPTFAQGVGLLVAVVGVVLGLAGLSVGLAIAAAAAFVAAFLNAVFDYCLGCQLYLLLVRARVLGRVPAAS